MKKKNIFNDIKDDTKNYNKKEIESGKGLGILSYIIPFIPFIIEKENKYVQYHAKQGMNLLIVNAIYYIIISFLTSTIQIINSLNLFSGVKFGLLFYVNWLIIFSSSIIGIGLSILYIIGIINVCNGKAKELPIINKIKIIK